MYILKQTNILKYGLITISLILSLFCFYVVVGFLGIQELTKPYPYGTFFTWVIIFFGIFYRFTFLLLTIGVFFGIVNVLEWHWIIALLFTLPSFVFIFPKQILNFKIKSKLKSKNTTSNKYSENSNSFSKKAEPTYSNNSKNDDIIEGDYKIINENKDKRD
tara:strand:- start:3302 stop:3784 length:483 start_codon:yes stop_codon:yes gene_type:complete